MKVFPFPTEKNEYETCKWFLQQYLKCISQVLRKIPRFGVNWSFNIFEAIRVLLTYCKLSSHKLSEKILRAVLKTSQKSVSVYWNSFSLISGQIRLYFSNIHYCHFGLHILPWNIITQSFRKILKMILRTNQTSLLGQN